MSFISREKLSKLKEYYKQHTMLYTPKLFPYLRSELFSDHDYYDSGSILEEREIEKTEMDYDEFINYRTNDGTDSVIKINIFKSYNKGITFNKEREVYVPIDKINENDYMFMIELKDPYILNEKARGIVEKILLSSTFLEEVKYNIIQECSIVVECLPIYKTLLQSNLHN